MRPVVENEIPTAALRATGSGRRAGARSPLLERASNRSDELLGLGPGEQVSAHGLSMALPEEVEMARPTGVKRVDAMNIQIPIEGAAES